MGALCSTGGPHRNPSSLPPSLVGLARTPRCAVNHADAAFGKDHQGYPNELTEQAREKMDYQRLL